MKMALEEAKNAFLQGEVPVGAILVRNGEIIARAHNCRESTKDPTDHAEMIAIKSITSKNDNWRMTDTNLYVTKEPCIMCAGAILNARIGRLIYGCKDDKGGAVHSLYDLLSDNRLNHKVEVTSGILEDECKELLQRFFRNRR